MTKAIRARYENGVLRPLEELDLKEGDEVEIIIYKSPSQVFGIILRRRPDIKPEDVDKIIKEIECGGVL